MDFQETALKGPMVLGASAIALLLLDTNKAIASPPSTLADLGQVTSVSQLSDVKPTDWAFQALQSLVERYGCIAGYPDRTYRGNRALTRYEFAAGLNACLDRVNELIAAATGDLVKKEDLAKLQRLQGEFAAELAMLRGRVDALDSKVATLEKQQFSTTTKLRGESIFSVAGVLGDERAGGGDLRDNTTFSYRARLNFDSSFTGKDQLRVRLQGRNVPEFSGNVTGTRMTRLAYDGDSGGAVGIDDLFYRFPLGDKTRVWLIANGYGSENIATPLNPFLQSDGTGTISRFGRFSPLYRIVDGPGLAIEQKLSDQLTFSAAYRARNASDPSAKAGLFDGNFGGLAQLTFAPTKSLSIAATYTRTYNRGNAVDLTGSTGSTLARQPFGAVATSANSYGVTASFRVSPQVNLSGWFGLSKAEARSGANRGADADVLNWSVALAFPDLGKKGNLGGVILGMPPKATKNDVVARADRDTSYHLEALYRYQVNDKISITPGLIMILNPEHNRNNDTQYVGVVRTTFTF
jgi:Carbohydrate-selective porin, OprB family/S-layer homology domain